MFLGQTFAKDAKNDPRKTLFEASKSVKNTIIKNRS